MPDRTISNTSGKSKSLSRPLEIIKDLFDYYKAREYRLVKLAYSLGAKNSDIADALEVDPGLVSRNYPKTKGGSR